MLSVGRDSCTLEAHMYTEGSGHTFEGVTTVVLDEEAHGQTLDRHE